MAVSPWTWIAHYSDASAGAALAEYDEEGQQHGWAEVNALNVDKIALHSIIAGLYPDHAVSIPACCRAIFFRRHERKVNIDGTELPEEQQPAVITVVGWQEATRYGNEAYAYFFADGSVLLSDSPDEGY